MSPGYGILSRRSARAARWIGSLLCLWPAWSAPSAAAAEAVGWRTDGSGEYLDADPPVRWSVAENVVWKTPLPSWSNATPVRVGERIFICSEPNVLLCLNAATGEIQWRRASDYLDAMAPDEAGRMRELAARMDIAGAQRQLRNLRGKIGRLDAELRQKTAAIERLSRDAERLPKASEAAGKTADERARIEAERAALRARAEQERPVLEAAAAELERMLEPVRVLLMPDTHGANGYSSPTPVSDGHRVWAFFTTGIVAAFDLDGRRLWTAMTEKPTLTYGVSASPLLVEGKIIVHPHDLHALDAATGRPVWRQPCEPRWGTPAIARIGGEGILLANNGEWRRVSDGARIAAVPAKASYHQPLVRAGVVYYFENGGGAFLIPDRLEEPPRRLWKAALPGGRYYASPVLHDGILYGVSEEGILVALDAAEGTRIYEQRLELGGTPCFPSLAIAGGYLYAHGSDGTTVVITPGRGYREVARNTLEPFRATPVFSGTRMYVRTLKHLYCIGR